MEATGATGSGSGVAISSCSIGSSSPFSSSWAGVAASDFEGVDRSFFIDSIQHLEQQPLVDSFPKKPHPILHSDGAVGSEVLLAWFASA